MSFLPAILVTTKEELQQKLQMFPMDIVAFSDTTGQDHFALHIDIILPEFAKERGCPPTLAFDEMVTMICEHFAGERTRFNIHVMGRADESLAVARWIVKTLVDERLYGEVYVPHYVYNEVKQDDHKNWLVGVWYDKGEWENGVEWIAAENLLMTVQAGYAYQPPDEQLKAEAFDTALASPEYYFVLDGGWKVDQNPNEEHIELVINSDYWKTIE